MKKETTARGFSLFSFKDEHGTDCTIQKSSLATKDCIWLGADKVDMKEFVAGRNPAWQDRPEFDEHSMTHHFVCNKRMHLSRTQIKKLLPILTRFVETGEI